MARRKRRRSSNEAYPGWVWMLFGLAVGLSVAFALYMRDIVPPVTASAPPQPAAKVSPPAPRTGSAALDNNGEQAAPPEQRFDFYNMLPKFEVVVPEQEADVTADTQPRAVVEPGVYVLQAGSFSRYEDADRRRAQLAMQGIESAIQRVAIDDRTYHRVRIGPIKDLNELNMLRSRLRQANIDVLRIRLEDQ
jgi:cell division protein FtsN